MLSRFCPFLWIFSYYKNKPKSKLFFNIFSLFKPTFSPDIPEDSEGTSTLPSYMIPSTEAPEMEEKEEEGGLEDALQVFKIFKLARVLKLARHSPGLQVS